MGGVGIWSMHFIGNQAIVLDSGTHGLQIAYSPGFTATSFFLPIIVLFAAFYILGLKDHVHWYFILTGGVLAGTAICGMHYVGQLGISNYTCKYEVGNVVGAAIIAVVASLVALSIFFRLRESWTDSWWKRSLCGALLAVAVSGMHWTAAVGTQYMYKGANAPHSGKSRVQTVIVCAVLSIVACGTLLGFSLVRTQKWRTQKTRAQQLVLATTYFDTQGRVMVTPEGSLPNVKITNHYVEKYFGEDELTRTHPAFIWVYKASRNWSAIRELVPGMQEALEIDPVAQKYHPREAVLDDNASDITFDFAVVFKQLFCVAAQNLAKIMQEPMEQLGVLFEEPMATGAVGMNRQSLSNTMRAPRFSRSSMKSSVDKDLNQAPYQFGRGQYLSLTRQLNKDEVGKFQAQGYRFATIKQINDPLARSMQVPKDWMLRRLERMRICASPDENSMSPGTHLACFMLRPSTVHKSFDVLVPLTKQNQLPTAEVQSTPLTDRQGQFLKRFDEMTLEAVLKRLVSESGSLGEPEEQEFRWHFYQAVERLVDTIGDAATMMGATLSATTVEAPCRPMKNEHEGANITCTLICVRLMQTIHASSVKDGLGYVPLSFFGIQAVVDASPANASWKWKFRQDAREEFRPLIGGGGVRGRSLRDGSSSAVEKGSGSQGRRSDSRSDQDDVEAQHHGIGVAVEMLKMPTTTVSAEPMDGQDTPTSFRFGPEVRRQSEGSTSPIVLQGQRHGQAVQEDGGGNGRVGGGGVFRAGYVNEMFGLFRL